MSIGADAVGLYVHVPFCARACPYCDFDFEVGSRPDAEGYLAALEREIDERELSGLVARTVYLGGGTPSMLGPRNVAELLARLGRRIQRDRAVETTVELNPEHVDAELLSALRGAGCDRVSIGAQSVDATGLVQLGRMHTGAQALLAVRSAADSGLSVSADVIVGWPGQTQAQALADIGAFLDAGARHVSVYALTIEEDTPWISLVRRGKRAMPDDDAQADLLSAVHAELCGRGWEHYEVASYAASADDRAAHNLGYWTGRDYVGLGPSAASARFSPDGAVTRRTNARGLAAWAADPNAGARVEHLAAQAAAAEGLWLALRVLTGVSVTAFLDRFAAVDAAWIRERVAVAMRRGDLVWEGDRLRVAEGRWLHHDSIAAGIVA